MIGKCKFLKKIISKAKFKFKKKPFFDLSRIFTGNQTNKLSETITSLNFLTEFPNYLETNYTNYTAFLRSPPKTHFYQFIGQNNCVQVVKFFFLLVFCNVCNWVLTRFGIPRRYGHAERNANRCLAKETVGSFL